MNLSMLASKDFYKCIMIFKAKNPSFTHCSAFIITYSDRIEQFYVATNIQSNLKGCRQTFQRLNSFLCITNNRATHRQVYFIGTISGTLLIHDSPLWGVWCH